MATVVDDNAAELYRRAQVNKMLRLGLVYVRRDEQGELVLTPAMDEMDPGLIVPDDIDFREARQA